MKTIKKTVRKPLIQFGTCGFLKSAVFGITNCVKLSITIVTMTSKVNGKLLL